MAKIETKQYECSECGHRKMIATNHFGECYSLGGHNACPDCPPHARPTVWKCVEPVPEGGWVPEPWKLVKMSDVVSFVEGD